MVFIECYNDLSTYLSSVFGSNWSYDESGTFELGIDRWYIWMDSQIIYAEWFTVWNILSQKLSDTHKPERQAFSMFQRQGNWSSEKSHDLVQVTERTEPNQTPAEEAAQETASTIRRDATGGNFSVYAVNPTLTYKAFHKHRRRAEFYKRCRESLH